MTLGYGRLSSRIFHENIYVRGILLCLFNHHEMREITRKSRDDVKQ